MSRWVLSELSQMLRPRVRLTVSQWADAHRIVSEKSSAYPGKWVTARNPLLRAIMDSLSEDCPVPEVVAMKPGQFGGTEVATNWLGYIMDHIRTPKPTMIVIPTGNLLVEWVLQRLRPMVESAKCLAEKIDVSKSRDGTNRLDVIDYPGGILFLGTANSSASLKSKSARFTVEDEMDEYPLDVGGKGDAESLTDTRKTAFARRKSFKLSTPSVEGASRIAEAYERSDRRQYHVCCPHCGERQVLAWEHLQWSADGDQVWYACAANGCAIEEREKPGMLREASADYPSGGVWIARNPERSRDSHGYQWNALYSPIGLGYSWRELVKQWLDAQGSDQKLQTFTNERLGLTWKDKRTAVRVEDLIARAEPYPLRTVPRGVGLVTAGVDTQDDRLAVQILGWGAGGAWWPLDYVELPGDTSQLYSRAGVLAPVYAALTDLLGRPLYTERGVAVPIDGTAHDMAGHSTEAVKGFVMQTRLPRYIAILGSRYRLATVLGRPNKVDYTHGGRVIRHGARYYPVGTELAKDTLYASIRGDGERPPGERLAHWPVDLVPPPPAHSSYLNGLLSEVWDARRQRYVVRRGMTRANEPLDTWVYAWAAAHHPEIRVDRLRPRDWETRERRLWGSAPEPSQAAPDAACDAPVARETPPVSPRRAPGPPRRPEGGGDFGKEGWGL